MKKTEYEFLIENCLFLGTVSIQQLVIKTTLVY